MCRDQERLQAPYWCLEDSLCACIHTYMYVCTDTHTKITQESASAHDLAPWCSFKSIVKSKCPIIAQTCIQCARSSCVGCPQYFSRIGCSQHKITNAVQGQQPPSCIACVRRPHFICPIAQRCLCNRPSGQLAARIKKSNEDQHYCIIELDFGLTYHQQKMESMSCILHR